MTVFFLIIGQIITFYQFDLEFIHFMMDQQILDHFNSIFFVIGKISNLKDYRIYLVNVEFKLDFISHKFNFQFITIRLLIFCLIDFVITYFK